MFPKLEQFIRFMNDYDEAEYIILDDYDYPITLKRSYIKSRTYLCFDGYEGRSLYAGTKEGYEQIKSDLLKELLVEVYEDHPRDTTVNIVELINDFYWDYEDDPIIFKKINDANDYVDELEAKRKKNRGETACK